MTNSKLQEFHATSAQLIRAVIYNAIKDTADCHWRVAEGPEEGSQMVRVRDLLAWAEQTASNLEKVEEQSND
jgi:hypothetical protein